MSHVHLLNVEKFRDDYPISTDADSKKIKNLLFSTQDVEIHGLLGTNLYNKILDLVRAGTIGDPGNAVYKTLLDEHIIKCLGLYGYASALITFANPVTDKGPQNRRGEFSSSSDIKTIQFIREEWTNRAEFCANLMVKFLCENSKDYPEYTDTTGSGIKANKEPFFGGIEFGL